MLDRSLVSVVVGASTAEYQTVQLEDGLYPTISGQIAVVRTDEELRHLRYT